MAGDAGRDAGGPAGQGQGLWKLEVARQVLAEDYGPRLDWVAVAKALDHERFNIPDQVSASFVPPPPPPLSEHAFRPGWLL